MNKQKCLSKTWQQRSVCLTTNMSGFSLIMNDFPQQVFSWFKASSMYRFRYTGDSADSSPSTSANIGADIKPTVNPTDSDMPVVDTSQPTTDSNGLGFDFRLPVRDSIKSEEDSSSSSPDEALEALRLTSLGPSFYGIPSSSSPSPTSKVRCCAISSTARTLPRDTFAEVSSSPPAASTEGSVPTVLNDLAAWPAGSSENARDVCFIQRQYTVICFCILFSVFPKRLGFKVLV